MTTAEILDRSKAIHLKKREDYTTDPLANPFENFERSAKISEWFYDPVDKSFAVLIGTKLARLGSLLSSYRTPNNESVEDTFVDLVTYAALWGEYTSTRANPRIDDLNKKTLAMVGESKTVNELLNKSKEDSFYSKGLPISKCVTCKGYIYGGDAYVRKPNQDMNHYRCIMQEPK